MRRTLILSFIITSSLFAQGGSSLEYDVKAAFINNFTKFVEWPREAFPGVTTPLKICIFGRDPFGGNFEQSIEAELGGRRQIVERPQTLAQLRTCHVAFIARSEQGRYRQVLDGLRDAAILTIGESPDFLQSGGIINFTVERNRVRFSVNLVPAERVALRISSRLLRLAETVLSGD
jgi:hypothetical protein